MDPKPKQENQPQASRATCYEGDARADPRHTGERYEALVSAPPRAKTIGIISRIQRTRAWPGTFLYNSLSKRPLTRELYT